MSFLFGENQEKQKQKKKSESEKEPRTILIFEIPKEVSWDTC
jgi:hypothetical protein